jgi:hypothetical protein
VVIARATDESVVKTVDDVAIVDVLDSDAHTEIIPTSDCVSETQVRGKRFQGVNKVEEVVSKRSRRGAQIEEPSTSVVEVVIAAPVQTEVVGVVIKAAPTPKGRSTRGRQQVVEEEVVVNAASVQKDVEMITEVAPTPKGKSTRGRQQVVEAEVVIAAPVQDEVAAIVIEVAPTPKGRSTRGRQEVPEEEVVATTSPVQKDVVEVITEVAPTPKWRSTRGRQQVVEEEVVIAAPVQEEVAAIIIEVVPTPKARSTRGRQLVVEEEKPTAEKENFLEGSARSTRKKCIDAQSVIVKESRCSRFLLIMFLLMIILSIDVVILYH